MATALLDTLKKADLDQVRIGSIIHTTLLLFTPFSSISVPVAVLFEVQLHIPRMNLFSSRYLLTNLIFSIILQFLFKWHLTPGVFGSGKPYPHTRRTLIEHRFK